VTARVEVAQRWEFDVPEEGAFGGESSSVERQRGTRDAASASASASSLRVRESVCSGHKAIRH